MAERARSIDTLRGAVMVLMVLDHARDFFVSVPANPTDLAVTSASLFFTRWVTHYCAPVFVLLAGTGAFLHSQKRGLAATRHFLWTRGLWMLVLELTIVRFAWIPDPFYRFSVLQVIWALGWAMLALALLSWLPNRAIGAIGALIVLAHNALDPIDRLPLPRGEWGIWHFLHAPGDFHFGARTVWEAYPVLPWVGVMALGFGLGQLFTLEGDARRRALFRLGLAATAAFVLLRASNIYGDASEWQPQVRGPSFTLMSFLNCTKYPPSLCYLLMTLGPALLVLAALERYSPRWTAPLDVFGRVPLFFYLAHLYLLRFTAAPVAYARFGSSALQPPPGHAGNPGFGLWGAYAAWACAILLLYPLCRWYARKKSASRSAWLSYL